MIDPSLKILITVGNLNQPPRAPQPFALGRPVIDKLEFLLALAREKHFGRAAKVSGVSRFQDAGAAYRQAWPDRRAAGDPPS